MSVASVWGSTTKLEVLGSIEAMKRVAVIASGETERRAVPHLVSHLQDSGIRLADQVYVPRRNRPLNADTAWELIEIIWSEHLHAPPDKLVVLLDVDRSDPEKVITRISKELSNRLAKIEADILYAYAQQHLEAWYFADSNNLRSYLGRSLGKVDASKPDEIENPKLHLKHVLGKRSYSVRVSEDIAMTLDAKTIADRSPSFRGFLQAFMNGSNGRGD